MAINMYLPDGRDFDDVFYKSNGGQTTGFKIADGTDIGNRYAAGNSGINTGYKLSNGADLGGVLGVSVAWENPAISTNGSLGGSAFAVTATGDKGSTGLYKAFDKSTSTAFFTRVGSAAKPTSISITTYNPDPVKLTTIIISVSTYGFNSSKLQYSDDGSTWVTVDSCGSGTTTITHTGYHKYWKFAECYGQVLGGWRNLNPSEIRLIGYVLT